MENRTAMKPTLTAVALVVLLARTANPAQPRMTVSTTTVHQDPFVTLQLVTMVFRTAMRPMSIAVARVQLSAVKVKTVMATVTVLEGLVISTVQLAVSLQLLHYTPTDT